ATEAEALAARQAVVTVSVRCAGQHCLPRSIASALLCRLYGRWPDWCTGIRLEPFRAHAWIAVDGRPVGELGDIAYFHTVMAVRAEP
ncbi:MAG TPA: lasso peptide biosynthesis B2 protein, partial [Thermomonospora sp.]|nr:lasso peptide biosynthesis B2 protein [Thermomonospora sp.]